jgi:hypothetical protein
MLHSGRVMANHPATQTSFHPSGDEFYWEITLRNSTWNCCDTHDIVDIHGPGFHKDLAPKHSSATVRHNPVCIKGLHPEEPA